ncbi:hypothetical protein [Piscirickettsia litoralis]|uniref:hypothetical protein n=1 Tax=Piscirickettsia litoralis TaxID=1891921 RepID=UPI000980FBDD|nr:hypothetical protein [Piscirickettsia litoralis]
MAQHDTLFAKSTKSQNHFNLPQGIYLLNHSVGCLPKVSQHAAGEFLQGWADSASLAWPDWLNTLNKFCEALATLLHSRPELFCPQVNLSSALTKIIYSLPKDSKKNTFVYSDLDFPSMQYIFQIAKTQGFKVKK